MSHYRPHLATISSFRIPCAVFVFLHHVEGHFGVPHSAFPFRRIVVSMFLVLSGYLLYSIYGSRARQTNIWEFYRKRVVRIYPLHWLILIFVLLLNWNREIGKIVEEPLFYGSKLVAHFALVQCWFPHPDFVLGINGVTWTLSVILFCYLLFPLLARAGDRLWLIFLAIFAIDLGWILYISPSLQFEQISGNNIVHFFPPFRMLEFMAGMLLAHYATWQFSEDWRRRRILMTVVDLMIAIGAIWLWYRVVGSFPYWIRGMESESARKVLTHWFNMIGFMVPSTVILLWYSMSNGYVAGGMRSRMMVFVGGVCYAFYLCHRPVMLKVEQHLSHSPLTTTSLVVICFGIVFLVSTAFYLLAEQPIRRRFGSGKAAQTKETTATAIAQARTDSLCGWAIIGLSIVAFAYHQSTWPTRQSIVFEDCYSLSINQAVDRGDEISVHFGWHFFGEQSEILLGYHLLDQNDQIIDTIWNRKYSPGQEKTSGVFWMHFPLDFEPETMAIALVCKRVRGQEMVIEPGNLDSKRLLNDSRWYVFWKKGDQLQKRPPRNVPTENRPSS